jgi:hypothetical protein
MTWTAIVVVTVALVGVGVVVGAVLRWRRRELDDLELLERLSPPPRVDRDRSVRYPARSADPSADREWDE